MSDAKVFDDNEAVWLVGAPADTPAAPLDRDLTVDVAIIGGGFTGVSTAYQLSKRNPKLGIALLEAKGLGNGASGRNGGIMLNGIQPDAGAPEEILKEHILTRQAIDDIEALIRDNKLAVRYRRGGSLKCATSPKAAEELHAEVEQLVALGLPLTYVTSDKLGEHMHARNIFGAALDSSEGVLNGVDLLRAMRPLLVAQGVQIFEGTRVMKVREGKVIELETSGGTVRANAIVLGTSGYTPRLGYFRSGLLPVISHVIATEPIPADLLARGFGTANAFADDLPRLAYASIDDQRRLVFGGGTNTSYGYQFGNRTAYAAHLDDKPARALHRSMTNYFPELASVPISHRWSGPLDLTLARHCSMGVTGGHGNIYYAVGYSGHGVTLGNMAGRVLADLYAGNHDAWRDYSFYKYKPGGIPPEPMRWIGYHAYTKLTGRSPWKKKQKA